MASLRQIRHIKDLKLKELTQLTGIHISILSGIESGRIIPKQTEIQKLEQALDCEGMIDWNKTNI